MCGGVGALPAEVDARLDDLRVEHGERGGHDAAGHLPEDAAAAGEVGRTVGHGDALAACAAAAVEAERVVRLVALGGEVHLADEGLEHRAEARARCVRLLAGSRRRRAGTAVSDRRPAWPERHRHLGSVPVAPSSRSPPRSTDELVAAFDRLIPQLSSSSPPPGRAGLEAIVAGADTALFVARVDGRIVGTLTLALYRIPTGLKAWIEDVVVDDAARGHGIGEALNRAALDEAGRRGAKDVSLTSRPSREAANRLYQRIGFQPRRDQPVPLHALIAGCVGCQVLGGLADLPVAVGERGLQGGRHLGGARVVGVEERRQREHGASADGRLVRRGVRGWRRGRGRRRWRPSAATADSRTSGSAAPVARATSRASTASVTTSCSPHAHAAVSTTGESPSSSSGSRSTPGCRAATSAGPAPHAGSGSAKADPQAVVVEGAEAFERAERGRPHRRVGVAEAAPRRGDVAGVPGHGDVRRSTVTPRSGRIVPPATIPPR